MLRKLFFVAFYVLLSYNCVAQSKTNYALAKKVRDDKTNKDEAVHMLIQGDVKQIETLVKETGGTFKYAAGNIVSVTISINQLSKIITDKSVKRVEAFPPQLKPLSDSVICHNNVLPVHAGEPPLTQGYDGTGVIIGFIDFGIDYNHPDFKNNLGKSRILWLWDQTKPTAANTPTPYGYGQEWSNTDIDNGLCTENPSAYYGHGTHVAGIAAGNGFATGGFLGTAPNADIIAVYINNSSPLTDAVNYIYTKAQAAGKPCVINESTGSEYGLHDGKDLVSQSMKNLIIANPGQAFVAAAGDGGGTGTVHLAYTVSPVDTNFTMFTPVGGNVYVDIVADSNNLKNIQFAIGADEMSPVYSFRGNIPFTTVSSMPIQTIINDTLFNGVNQIIGAIQYYLDTVNGDYDLQCYITPDSTSYNWRLMATGTGAFDLWNYNNNSNYNPIVNSGLPSAKVMRDSMYYKYPDIYKSIEGGFQCVDPIISVACYYNRRSYTECNGSSYLDLTIVPNQLSPSSALGPTRDGRVKPDISSPGSFVMAAVDSIDRSGFISQGQVAIGCYHVKGAQTSAAAPGVAGIAALYLQKNPTATAFQVQQAIINSAVQDQFTGSVPNQSWGYGKANAFAALTGIPDTLIQPVNTTVCENDTAVFTVRYNRTGLTYQWQVNQGSRFNNLSNVAPYSGVTTDTLTIAAAPASLNGYSYQCIIGSAYSCNKTSSSATLTVNPAPTITTVSDSICFSASAQTSPLTYTATTNAPTTYTIVWNTTAVSQGFVPVTNTPLPVSPVSLAIPANATATIYTGTITVTNVLGCSSISGNNFTVTIDTLPIATAGGSTSICSIATATVSGASAANGTIFWTDNGSGPIAGATTLTPTYTAVAADVGNTVTLTMTVTATNSCAPKTAIATYTVNVNGLPTAIAGGSDTICQNLTATVNGASATNGTILWTRNGSGSITSGATTLTPVYAAATGDAGNIVTLTMTVTSTNSCAPQTAVATYTVNVNALPTATAGGSQTICENASATITGANATNGSIIWTGNGAGTITGTNTLSAVYTSTNADVGSPVTLTITVTATNNCAPQTATATYTINVNALPTTVSFSGLAPSYCFNASAKALTGKPPGGLFSGNGITSASAGTFNPAIAGSGNQTITYTYTNNSGCSNTASLNTIVLPVPTDIDSCTTIDLSSNVFTPNGDGINDVFSLNFNGSPLTFTGSSYGNFVMNVYDRWGNLIFNTYSPSTSWDGTTNSGVNAPAGTYYYVIEYGGKKYRNFIMLIR